MRVKLSADSLSHISHLVPWVQKTTGPILELGIGFGSTPILHELCRPDRELVSYENIAEFFALFRGFDTAWHKMILTPDYAAAEIERPWSIAFVDTYPGPTRLDLLMRLKPWADYIIIHDTERRHDRFYHVRAHFREWKYRVSHKQWEPHTTVLSDRFPVA